MRAARGLPVQSVWIYIQAAVVGLLGGALGVWFRIGTTELQQLLMGPGGPVETRLPPWWSVVLPAAGGLIAGIVIVTIRNVRGPFGIADVMELVQTRHGRIQPLRSLAQILSSGLSIASGGSIGREGANSQFGATIASVLGHLIPNSPRSRTVLLGCGIAAGMSSAYMAPIAGSIFVMEVLLGNFAMDVLAPIVVSAVVATLVTGGEFGFEPLYSLGPDVALRESALVLSAALLGALCGCGGPLFRWSLGLGRRTFQKIALPVPARMALGGAIVGTIGIWFPEVWGNGQATIYAIADEGVELTFGMLAALFVLKVVATSVTAGSGALGGVFTPNLVVGAAFGAAFAYVVDAVVDGIHRTEFALVGMAGLCAATTHAPITAIVLIFEMTHDYGLILPLMLCSIIASIVSRMIDKSSIYTARLQERGHQVFEGIEELAMHRNYVRDVMRSDAPSVRPEAPFDEVLELFNSTRHDALYVVDAEGQLLGHIGLHDVKEFINDPTLASVVIAQDLTRNSPFTVRDESLAAIMPKFDDPDLDELPVVESHQSQALVGRVTRRDVVACFSEEVLGQRTLRAKFRQNDDEEATFVQLPDGIEIARLAVPMDLADRSLESLDLTGEHGVTPLLVLRTDALRQEHRMFAEPGTVLTEGDAIIALGRSEAIQEFRELQRPN